MVVAWYFVLQKKKSKDYQNRKQSFKNKIVSNNNIPRPESNCGYERWEQYDLELRTPQTLRLFNKDDQHENASDILITYRSHDSNLKQ